MSKTELGRTRSALTGTLDDATVQFGTSHFTTMKQREYARARKAIRWWIGFHALQMLVTHISLVPSSCESSTQQSPTHLSLKMEFEFICTC